MWAYHLSKIVIQPPLRWYFRSKVIGAEHVPPEGPLIVTSSHASFLDPWFVAERFPRSPIRFLINARWYYRSRISPWVFAVHGTIPTVKSNAVATILRVRDALRQGDMVGVFPEGRISHDGRLQRARHGVGWIAALSGVPVVPCGLRGNYEALPRQRKVPRRHPVELRIGEPLSFSRAPTPDPDPRAVHDFVVRLASVTCDLTGQVERRAEALPRPPALDLRAQLHAQDRGAEGGEEASLARRGIEG